MSFEVGLSYMLDLNYDEKSDVADISFTDRSNSYSDEEDGTGIIIFRDCTTDEITGITI